MCSSYLMFKQPRSAAGFRSTEKQQKPRVWGIKACRWLTRLSLPAPAPSGRVGQAWGFLGFWGGPPWPLGGGPNPPPGGHEDT